MYYAIMILAEIIVTKTRDFFYGLLWDLFALAARQSGLSTDNIILQTRKGHRSRTIRDGLAGRRTSL